ncbi:MAG: assimilatory sulfite reductase (NADPH) hemoprotein subunit [Pseudomonadota bacterium]
MNSNVNEVERIKARSNFLRGTLEASLADNITGALAPDDAQISKFHGFYEQDDRDQRDERHDRILEPYYSLMLRARLPGGVCTPQQWLTLDEIGRTLANGTLRLTTRQTFQYHGVLKQNIKAVIQGINRVMIDSIGGCGDVNRNVLCNPNPTVSELHQEVHGWARRISEHLLPRTQAYHEIWLDGEKLAGGKEHEPIYGPTYLPRKFKTAVAVPPDNDVDLYANDLGFIAIAEAGRLQGFNVTAGGGMGATHGDTTTYPRLADELGFVKPEQVLAVAEAMVTVQRDHGNRADRRHARLKYTIDQMGVEQFRYEVASRAGVNFALPKPVSFTSQGDRYGWVEGADGQRHLTLYIESGRVVDRPEQKLMTGLREIAGIHQGDFRITPNQNLIVARVPAHQQGEIESIAEKHGLLSEGVSSIRKQGLACVALPTCPQAMAEAERYLPGLFDKVEAMAERHGIGDTDCVIRITGCPNGCARPYLAELGLVGKGPGHYNLYLGGDGKGTRLNKRYRENLGEAEVLETMDQLLEQYAADRKPGERLGDFTIRTGLVTEVKQPARDFHD